MAMTTELALLISLALILVLIVVYLLDINYFLRVGLVLVNAWLIRKPLGFLDESVLHARVLPCDADVAVIHMNNARVMREFDFGRWDWGARNGLLKYSIFEDSEKFSFVVAAHAVRYRKPLLIFMKYKITTKIVYWEGNVVYFKQNIVTLNDDIIRTTAYCKAIISVNVDDFVGKRCPGVVKPKAPKDLRTWIQFNQENSQTPCQGATK